MPDVITPNFGFTEPEVGASKATWGNKLNTNWVYIDTLLQIAYDEIDDLNTNALLKTGGAMTGPLTIKGDSNGITFRNDADVVKGTIGVTPSNPFWLVGANTSGAFATGKSLRWIANATDGYWAYRGAGVINELITFADVEGEYLPLVGGTMTGTLNMNSNTITNLPAPAGGANPVTLTYGNANYGRLSFGNDWTVGNSTNRFTRLKLEGVPNDQPQVFCDTGIFTIGGSGEVAVIIDGNDNTSNAFFSILKDSWEYSDTTTIFRVLEVGTIQAFGDIALQQTGVVRANGQYLYIEADTQVRSTTIRTSTTASAANMFSNTSTDALMRSTSSEQHKTILGPVDETEAVQQVLAMEPLEYLSLHDGDDPRHVFRGFTTERMTGCMGCSVQPDDPENYDTRAIIATLTAALSNALKRIEVLEA